MASQWPKLSCWLTSRLRGFSSGAVVKNPPAMQETCRRLAGDVGLISGSVRSPRGVHGNPLQYSCLENPWTGDPGELQSMGSKESDMDEHTHTHLWTVTFYFALSLGRSQFSSVQSLSRVRLFATPWIAARQASLSITNSRSSPRLTSIELVMPSSHLILCRPLLLLAPIPPSIRVFSNSGGYLNTNFFSSEEGPLWDQRRVILGVSERNYQGNVDIWACSSLPEAVLAAPVNILFGPA